MICVSRVYAPQWGSFTDTRSHGPLNAQDPVWGDLYGGCGGKKDGSVITGSGGQYEVSQKVEFCPDHLDYLPRDDSFSSSLVFISNSGGPVCNSRADGYGGGRCSFKPTNNYRLGKRRERKTCGLRVSIITRIRHVYGIENVFALRLPRVWMDTHRIYFINVFTEVKFRTRRFSRTKSCVSVLKK